jgi:POT family proton-dependent oligopeptide transporter
MEVEKGHPKGLYVLFFTEMWERFSYYGMRALLIFYCTDTFLLGDKQSYAIYGSYTALVYLTPVFGGIVADRLLGYKRGIIAGASLMALGHFFMAIETEAVFYFALALLIVGNGFFKPNMSTMVGQLYRENDPRRDAGYTVFYMGVNLGAFIAPIATGFVGKAYGWHWGFTLAGVGMVGGLINFLYAQKIFKGIGDPPDLQKLTQPVFGKLSRQTLVWIGAAVCVAACWKLMQEPAVVGYLLTTVGVIVFTGVLLYSFVRCEGQARHRLWVALTLTAFSVVFWAFFEQAGSSLNLFTERNVNKVVLGWTVPAPVMQSINPIFILLFGGLFAALWVNLGRIGREPAIPLKFGLGILQLGAGFYALYYGAVLAQGDGIVAFWWLALGYLLHTTGELCLSPVGLSMITKLSPREITGMMMGTWYLSISFAQYAAGMIAQLTGIEEAGEGAASIAPVDTVMVYGDVFGKIALVAVGVGILVMILSPLINRGTHGIR